MTGAWRCLLRHDQHRLACDLQLRGGGAGGVVKGRWVGGRSVVRRKTGA